MSCPYPSPEEILEILGRLHPCEPLGRRSVRLVGTTCYVFAGEHKMVAREIGAGGGSRANLWMDKWNDEAAIKNFLKKALE